jgi:hypothetical protein
VKNKISGLWSAGFCMFFALSSLVVYAQDATYIQLSSHGASSNLDSLAKKMDRRNSIRNHSIPSLAQVKAPFTNNKSVPITRYQSFQKQFPVLMSGDPIGKMRSLRLDSNTVFNNKYMNKYYDSIKGSMPVLPNGISPTTSQDQLVNEVNNKFRSESKIDSVQEMRDRAIAKRNDGKSKIDLAKTKISQDELSELKPMAASLIKSKYLDELDSIRKVDMKTRGIQMAEKKMAEDHKVASIKEKEKIWNKSYFEGIVSLIQGNDTQFQLSPALAYHLNSRISIGAGPNLMVRKDLQKISLTGGMRAFVKSEFFNRHLYAQLEDQMNPHTLSSEGSFFSQHNLYAGGGYVLPFFSPLTLNLSLMYKFYSNGDALNASSPWMIRVGISTHNKNK